MTVRYSSCILCTCVNDHSSSLFQLLRLDKLHEIEHGSKMDFLIEKGLYDFGWIVSLKYQTLKAAAKSVNKRPRCFGAFVPIFRLCGIV